MGRSASLVLDDFVWVMLNAHLFFLSLYCGWCCASAWPLRLAVLCGARDSRVGTMIGSISSFAVVWCGLCARTATGCGQFVSFLLPSVGLSSVAFDGRFSYGVQSYIIFGEDNVCGGRELRIINGFNKFDDIERLNDGKIEILAGAALCDL